MARIRTIKPEYWSSPDTAACADPWARLLYIAMWNWADDNGRGTANPKELAGFAFPNDDHIDSTRARCMLDEIRRAFGVIFYKIGGRTYYAIPAWDDHQKIDRRSAKHHPAPEEGEPWDPNPPQGSDQEEQDEPQESHEGSTDSHEDSTRARRDVVTGTGEQGNRGTGEQETPSTAPRIEDDRFEVFWKAYPRRVEKRAAEKAWRAALKRKVSADLIIAAAGAYGEKVRDTDAHFIKHPASWLNAGAYADDHSSSEAPDIEHRAAKAFDSLRAISDAHRAAKLIRQEFIVDRRPRDGDTPNTQRQRIKIQELAFIDAHEAEIRAALMAEASRPARILDF